MPLRQLPDLARCLGDDPLPEAASRLFAGRVNLAHLGGLLALS